MLKHHVRKGNCEIRGKDIYQPESDNTDHLSKILLTPVKVSFSTSYLTSVYVYLK